MGTPELTDELCRKLIDGVAEEARSRSIQELERERDALLVGIQEVIAARRGPKPGGA